MALKTFVAANCRPSISLSFPKFCPKIWSHCFPSSNKSVQKSWQACLAAKSNQEVYRPIANFSPTLWKDTNTFSSNLSILEFELYDRLMEEPKQKVKEMLLAPTKDPAEKVKLIDSLCHLGVSYHFETEIEEQLDQIFETQPNFIDQNDYDLYTVALLFRVFRQHGYKMSSGVFNKFRDSDGKFKKDLSGYIRDMLSLYEATHLRVHGEDILEEALDFTTAHLKYLAVKASPHLEKHIIDALEHPYHKSIPRVAAYRYITFYEEDYKYRNEILLKFAKLDFNRVQLVHQQELNLLMSWWKDFDFASKFPYARDRIVEIYFWGIADYFEPCYSRARIMHTKIMIILTIIDDTYDAYGTLEELQSFTDALQRWDTNAMGDLPDYLKTLYSVILNLYDELNNEVGKEGRSYSVSFAKEKLQELVRAYFLEAKWFNEGYVPSFDERLDNALITGTCFYGVAALFVGMEEIAGQEVFEWLRNLPKIDRAAYLIGRLRGDMVSHKFEQERGHVASTMECYMRDYGVSRDEAVEKFQIMIADAWKDINEECMKPTVVPMQILQRLVNIARLVELFYKDKDGISFPETLKDYITKLFVDRMPV